MDKAVGVGWLTKDEPKLIEAIEGAGSEYIAMLEPVLARQQWICGHKMTVIDFWAGSLYCDKFDNESNLNGNTRACWAKVLKKYPNFKRFGEDFKKENASWLAKRENLEF